MKQLLVKELPSTAAVLIASKSAEAYHQSFIGTRWKTFTTAHPCVVLGLSMSATVLAESDVKLADFGSHVNGTRTVTRYFVSRGGSFGEEARKGTQFGGADETQQQRDARKGTQFGGADENQQQRDARERCGYGGANENQQQRDARFGGAAQTQQQKDKSLGGSGMTKSQKESRKSGKRQGCPNQKKRGQLLYKLSSTFLVVASFKTQEKAAKDLGVKRPLISRAIANVTARKNCYFAYGFPGLEIGQQAKDLLNKTPKQSPKQKNGGQRQMQEFFASKTK